MLFAVAFAGCTKPVAPSTASSDRRHPPLFAPTFPTADAYMRYLNDRIGRDGRVPCVADVATGEGRYVGGTVELDVVIARDDGLYHVEIVKPSGVAALDYAAVRRVWRAAPFAPLPDVVPGPEVRGRLIVKYVADRAPAACVPDPDLPRFSFPR